MDGRRDQAEPDDVVMQQGGYPSPTVDSGEAGPYYHNAHSMKPDVEQHLVAEEHHEDQEPQDAQEHATPHRHQSRPSVSVEELQLAAQLTQGLAPIMAAHNQAQEGQMQAQEADMHTQDASFQDQSHNDSNLQEHLQRHLQNNDHGLPNVVSHVEQSQHYESAPPSASHLQPHIPLDHMAQQYQLPDNIPPRKRSKVSRACDECRRKKIKCDAASDTTEEPCSNCRRTSSRCLFSRIPQKRGPSKGYIKELADRIHSIEGKLGAGANADALESTPRSSADAFSSPMPLDESRKRPFSSISGDFGTPATLRHAAWGADPRPIQPYQSPAFRPLYSANSLAPQVIGPKGDEPKVDGVVLEASQLEQLRGIDEGAFDVYLANVHHAFPVLPASRQRVHELLALCPIMLREAFLEAFYALVHQPRASPPGHQGDIRTANHLLADWEGEPNSRTSATDLVHLQTLILMAIETDYHGPASLRGLEGGPSKASILGRAVGLAYSMGLHRARVESNPEAEVDVDAEENVGLRAWWVLVTLDRWNAIGTATPTMISNDTVVVLPGLKPIVGEGGYSLIHLSNFIGHFVPMSFAPPKELNSAAGPVIGSWVNLALEGFRSNFPSSMTPTSHPLVHLAYWHCRLLSYLFSPAALSTDIIWAIKETVGIFTANPHFSSPLNHHFTGLAALSLLELSRVEKTREEANRLLRELLDALTAPGSWEDAVREKIADKVRPSTSSGLDSLGLQHLADLATATTGKTDEPAVIYRTTDNYENVGFDPRPMLQSGYLNAFNNYESTQAATQADNHAATMATAAAAAAAAAAASALEASTAGTVPGS